jgi:putative SOS response-associated peptidase YedK
MCGRYNLRSNQRQLAELFGIADFPEFAQRWNIAPTQTILTVRAGGTTRPAFLRWGLVPFWSKDPKAGPPLINARSETVREKPSFRAALKSRRCLIPASGFYEWKRDGKTKQPFHIGVADWRPFAFAGLWETWNKGPEPVESCCIVTTDANDLMRTIHDRMPVIVDPADFDEWLSGEPDAAAELLRPFPPDAMIAYATNPVVNNARNDAPECIEPLDAR